MKSSLYIIGIAFLAILYTGCYDDKGNYDYRDISETKISGIQDKYTRVSYTDTLKIDPAVTSTDQNDSYEYLWVINKAYSQVPSMGEKIKKDTIGTERVLNYPVNLKMGQYELVLKVTNQNNGNAVFHETALEVTTPFSLGFYVMKEENNHTEIDLHLPNGKQMDDILTLKYGNPMLGTPKSLGLIFSYCYIDPETNEYTFTPALTICADNDAKILNLQDMSTIFTLNDMFWGGSPANEVPLYICPNYYGINYLSNKGVYFSYQYLTIPGTGKFGYPVDIEDGCNPNINCIFSMCLYFFDELNHRFLVCDFNGSMHTYTDLPELPYNLKFFGHNKVGTESRGYALFKDENSNKMYLYSLILNTKFSENPIKTTTEVATTSNLNTANLFAINEQNARVMYCVSNNKIYLYDLESNVEEPMNCEGLLADEEITYISNRFWLGTDDTENNFNYLAIGTYKNGNYKVYLYKTLGGKPVGAAEKVLQGKGKMVKMQFISNKMNENPKDSGNYPATF